MARMFALQNGDKWLLCTFIDYENYPISFSGHVMNGNFPITFKDDLLTIKGRGEPAPTQEGWLPVWSGRVPKEFAGDYNAIIDGFLRTGEYKNFPELEAVEPPGKITTI